MQRSFWVLQRFPLVGMCGYGNSAGRLLVGFPVQRSPLRLLLKGGNSVRAGALPCVSSARGN